MDRVTEQLLNDYSADHGIANLPEEDRFEHLACYVAVGQHCAETFDPIDVLMAKATGIDCAATIVNGNLITEVQELNDIAANVDLDVTFVFVQADRGSGFDLAKIGNFTYAVGDCFKKTPAVPRNQEIKNFVAIADAVYARSAKFRKGNPNLRMYFVTTGKWAGDSLQTGKVTSVIEEFKAGNLFGDVTFVPVGAVDLQKLYRQRTSAVEREFTFEKRVTMPPVPGVDQAHIGFLPFPELMKLVADGAGLETIGSLFYSFGSRQAR